MVVLNQGRKDPKGEVKEMAGGTTDLSRLGFPAVS
jgi:hypothetical protein